MYLNSIVFLPSKTYGTFPFFFFFFFFFSSLTLAFTNCQIKELIRTMKSTLIQTKLKHQWRFSNLTLYRTLQLVTYSRSRGDHRKEGASNTPCLLSASPVSSKRIDPGIYSRCVKNETLPNCPSFPLTSWAISRVYKMLRSTLNSEVKSVR